ncbi:MAG: gamma-glutamyltransferase [Promethearchaeota archaeon]
MGIPFRFEEFGRFNSRRSPILSFKGIVASSEAQATMAGIKVLQAGGNAADAAVATAAAIAVTEPMSTGLGGDAFCLFYDANKKKVFGINASGPAPAALTLDEITRLHGRVHSIPVTSPHAVTVPGAAAGWIDTVKSFGRLEMREILKPAIDLAEHGFPAPPLVSFAWAMGSGRLKKSKYGKDLLIKGRAPEPGEKVKNQKLANVLREIAKNGRNGFYSGWVARAIVSILSKLGGVMSITDLEKYESQHVEPIAINYRGVDVHEIPPNGQGITALIALNILEGFELDEFEPLSSECFHLQIESLRLAFAESKKYVADPRMVHVPINQLLSKEYASTLRQLIKNKSSLRNLVKNLPDLIAGSDTVYLSVVDGEGNACSFINSNYHAFGTGIVPKNCGFVLQNRGCNFSLDPNHPNVLEPNKRPYHTIIPGMTTQDDELHSCFGVMGGFMQPQGHVQVISRMIDHEFDPQAALDSTRFYIIDGNPDGEITIEDSIPLDVFEELKSYGHSVKLASGWQRSMFGRGQIIRRNPDSGLLWSGSDPRSDGCAIGL